MFNLISREEDAKNEVTKNRQDRWHLVSICARWGTLCVVVTNGLSGRDSGHAQDIFITLAPPLLGGLSTSQECLQRVHKDPGGCCMERENYPRTNHREATGIPTQASCPLSSGQWIQSWPNPASISKWGLCFPGPTPVLCSPWLRTQPQSAWVSVALCGLPGCLLSISHCGPPPRP